MKSETMVHNANQIARFFASYPHEQAVHDVADHVMKFWEPRLRRQLIQHIHGGAAGLDPLVVEAAGLIAL